MVSIKVVDKSLKDVWDYQRATYILRMCGLSSDGISGLTQEEKYNFEEKITFYLWEQIKKQFPKIEDFCNSRTGGFNKCEKNHFNTPIINIHGSFYLQLITLNNINNWCWEIIDLTPYRFEFNEEGYFKGLVVDGINKAIIEGTATKETFKKLIEALNETSTEESVLTIQTRGKDCGKVDLHEVETTLK